LVIKECVEDVNVGLVAFSKKQNKKLSSVIGVIFDSELTVV